MVIDSSNAQPSSSSQSSSSASSSSTATTLRQRHSAPASFGVYRRHSHSHSYEADRRDDPGSVSTWWALFELFQYLFIFIITYLKFVLQRVFPYGATVLDRVVVIPGVTSHLREPIITEPPPTPPRSRRNSNSHFLLPPVRSSTPKHTTATNASSASCQRPCCRSTSTSTSSDHHSPPGSHYSSIQELYSQPKPPSLLPAPNTTSVPLQLPFPLSLFPLAGLLTTTVAIARDCLTLNRLLSFNRIARYYKRTVTMRERFRNLFRWRPTSPEELDQAETKILSHLKTPYKTYYVDIGKGWDLENVLIWTLEVPTKQALVSQVTNGSAPAVAEQQNGTSATPPTDHFVPAHLQGLPLVMVHGFAAGVALWSLNLDALSAQGKRHIFAFDLLGFAKSSRPKWTFPKFSNLTSLQQSKAEAEAMEEYMVDSIEKWRRAIGGPLSEKFVLLGHSFGAYLCTAYALRYPEHVAHVILADPWGFPADSHTRAGNNSHYTSSRQLPLWLQFAGRLFLDVLTPLAGLRAAGPWGPKIISGLRPDLKKKFAKLAGEGEVTAAGDVSAPWEADISSSSEDETPKEVVTAGSPGSVSPGGQIPAEDMVTNYIYHCNAHCRPSGEIAFKKLCTHTGWARMPMLERVIELDPHITLSFIYGSRSWIDRQPGFQTKYILATAANSASALAVPNSSSDSDTEEAERVNVHIMERSGHHVYADEPEKFNQLVGEICEAVECTLMRAAMEEQGNDFEWDDEDEDDSFLQQQLAAGIGGDLAGQLPVPFGNGAENWQLENGGAAGSNAAGAAANGGQGGQAAANSKHLLQGNSIPEEESY